MPLSLASWRVLRLLSPREKLWPHPSLSQMATTIVIQFLGRLILIPLSSHLLSCPTWVLLLFLPICLDFLQIMFSKWLSSSPRKQLNRLRSQSWSFSKKIWKLIADILVISGLTFHQKAHSMHGKPQNSPRLIIRSIFLLNSNHRSAQPLLHIQMATIFSPHQTQNHFTICF